MRNSRTFSGVITLSEVEAPLAAHLDHTIDGVAPA